MEFSVKRSDLLDELNLTQGVVERKSTIPILSNLLVEAKEAASRLRRPILNSASAHLVKRRSKKRAPAPFRQRSYSS